MNSDFIPYGRQTITDEDINAVINTLKEPRITQGEAVPVFENLIANKVDCNFSIAVNSATSALHLACLSLGLTEGDYLWTSPITFVASANCGRYCGAMIDFVDIDPETGLMSIECLESKLIESAVHGTLPKIVIPVHLAGNSCEMESIWKLSKKYDFYIIEDASHAIGGSYDRYKIGSCRYSDITVFSFHPVKIITTAEGGVATTNQKKIADNIRKLRSHGIIKDREQFINPNKSPWVYEQQQLGYNYRMTDIQAALGISQLSRLESIVLERQSILQRYQEKMTALPIKFLKTSKNISSATHLAIIILDKYYKKHHEKIFIHMLNNNVGVQLHYMPVHLQPYYRQFGFSENNFPASEGYAQVAFSIPLYPGLTVSEQDYVVDTLAEIILECKP